ncbi:MAG: hypothetical protein SFX72_10885 [Isosphaeraceae bacterium]|nr:hypothetical protein [Isosphaeraceae bacterium]
MSTDPTKPARLAPGIHAAAAKSTTTPVQVGTSDPAAEQKRPTQQQLRARGQIKSAVSLDSSTIQVRLKQPLKLPVANPALYQIPGLTVTSATRNKSGTVVTLETSTQAATKYQLTMIAPPKSSKQARAGLVSARAVVTPSPTILGTIPLTGTAPPISSTSGDLPRVVSATSTSNNTVAVQFNEPMSDRSLVAQYYEITPTNINTESGRLIVKNARFQEFGTGTGKIIDRSTVILTTESQNELDYTVRVANMVDIAGNPLAPPVIVGGLRFDPTVAQFQGTPPQAAVKNGVPTLLDTDGDGLFDNEEQRGWRVTVIAADGTVTSRTVTSDIRLADSDGDGLSDYQEANLVFDPRAVDTDGDQLNDYAEFNETYSNGLAQDTDKDGLDDFVEFAFFKTSPIFADSDGDQIKDGDEIAGNRNALVSDLPRPEIEVGAINLQLDVRFSESNAKETRDLDTKSVTSTLSQSESRSLSRQSTQSLEAKLEGVRGYGDGGKDAGSFWKLTAGYTAGFTFQQTEESSNETTRSYENSLTTEQEVTNGFTVERQVVGAVMQATVNLRNVSNLAYRVKNLQVTAFIQDPQDRTRLTPVATLLPDSEPAEGFTLGPFVTNRGPLIFSNTTIVPTLVESLMANSAGLIFRISNYDIINEDGRNFAFISQDVVERTAQLVIDFGGARSLRAKVSGETIDENLPGDETEIHRVSTAQGRRIDTNGDGAVDDTDRRVTFDGAGKEVGITLFDALAAAGLKRFETRLDPSTGEYEEYVPGDTTPVDTSTAGEEDRTFNSYSTYVDAEGREKIFRIRQVANDFGIKKYWEILTPRGIDQQTLLSELILKTNAPTSLNFVQDLDGDLVPADTEYLLRTSDSPRDEFTYDSKGQRVPGSDGVPDGRDTDGDGLDDRFEALIGWRVNTPLKSYTVYSSPTRKDSNFDSPKPGVDSDEDGVEDRLEYDGSDMFAAPAGWNDKNGNGLRDLFEVSQSDTVIAGGVPYNTDTTQDVIGFLGLDPFFNPMDPYFTTGTLVHVARTEGGLTSGTDYWVRYRGFNGLLHFYSLHNSASDAAANIGLVNLTDRITSSVFSFTRDWVLDPIRKDTDGDGISDATELIGFRITRIENGASQLIAGTDPLSPFTDSDTFTDGFEKFVGLDPTNGADTDEDGDGLPDIVETTGWAVGKLELNPEIQTINLTGSLGFTLQFGTGPSVVGENTTGTLSESWDADRVQTELNNLGVIAGLDGRISVIRAVLTNPSRVQFTVTFGGDMAGKRQPTLLLTKKSGTGAGTVLDFQKGHTLTYLEGVSQAPYQSGPQIFRTSKSQTDSIDSDGDGLTDYEEFFLRTDARANDTDGDGIEDRVEYLGFNLGHKIGKLDGGIIKTDPLDSDTDNDLRSDGDEAELVDIELDRWVVRATGSVKSGEVASSSAYRVFSHPLVADADFDGLVDGEEYGGLATNPIKYRTDPNNANTDGDKRDDGEEVRGGLNPLLEDFRVTVVADWVETFNDGTEENINGRGYGRYQFLLGVRQPSSTGVAGLSTTPTLVMDNPNQAFLVDEQGEADSGDVDDRYGFGYSYGSGAASFPARSLDARSLVFSVSRGQRFSVDLNVREFDGVIPATPTLGSYRQVDVGGLEGNPVYKKYKPVPGGLGELTDQTSTVFSADDVLSLTQSVQDLYFFWDSASQTSQRVNGYNGGRLRGLLHVYLVIE